MNKNDLTGWGLSALIHGGLIVAFMFVSASAPATPGLGYIEVDFGTLAEGRQVKEQPEIPDETPEEAPEEIPEEVPEDVTPPPAEDDIELPEETPVEDTDIIPETIPEDVIPPEEAPEEIPEEQPEETPPAQNDSNSDSGAETGDDGQGADVEAASPYMLEGIDRTPLRTSLPSYNAQVNAVITIRITVGADGRISRKIPLVKGNPALEQAVMAALDQWRFNPLPAGVPQKSQTGKVTFRFSLQ